MKKRRTSDRSRVLASRHAFFLVLAALMVIAPLGTVRNSSAQAEPGGVQFVTGTMVTDNPIVISYASEPFFSLWDMTPYVNRDRGMAIPVASQVIAAPIGDLAEGQLSFKLALPITPLGSLHDLDNDTETDAGVQLFSVEFGWNSFGDPFLSPEEGGGWGEFLSSLAVTTPEGEVVGGQVLIWSPDDEQSFSSGLGPDGFFLTDDDPVGPVEAGWTFVDLNSDPFELVRDESVDVTFNPGDDGFNDLSELSFTESFTALLDELELRYAFTQEKGIDWAGLRATYLPMIEEAEANEDIAAFSDAIALFSLEFPDGHVGGGITQEFVDARIGGRLGMRLAETDTGEVIVITVTEGLPADLAGIEAGATIIEWNGVDPTIAVEDAPRISPSSSPHADRLFLYELMTRGPLGGTVQVTFQNEGGGEESVELTLSEDIEGRDVEINTRLALEDSDPLQLPVEMSMLDSGIALIRINTFYADSIMMTSAWDTAIDTLNAYGIPGLIIDVRDNGGGFGNIPLYMAGSFFEEQFDLFESEFLNTQGVPVVIGTDTVHPVAPRYEFPIALIIDEGCASACEIFAAAIAHNPDTLIVGYNPTAGVEAGVFQWLLPGGVQFQASVLRVTSGGEIAIEGEGVPPTFVVPRTRDNLMNPEDELLTITEEALIPIIVAFFEEEMPETQATPDADPMASPVAALPDATPEASPVASPAP